MRSRTAPGKRTDHSEEDPHGGGAGLSRTPAIVGIALAFSAGVVLSSGGLPGCAALLLLTGLLRPRWPFSRPETRILAVVAVVVAGVLHGTVIPPSEASGARASRAVGEVRTGPGAGAARRLDAAAARSGLESRILRVFPREGGMVAALVLAERGGLDRGVRDAFTRSGAAHLLAISGFHVGILAGWIVLLARALGLRWRGAALVAALAVWGYVALLGFPTSAVRAGLLLSGAAAGRLRGRPVHALGGWGLALLLVALVQPQTLGRAGTQLSFAGALGLLLWVGPWSRRFKAAWSRLATRCGLGAAPRRWGGAVAEATAASCAAQLATLPLAVWHFQRVAVLGLPATLLATPLVSFALPGALLTLLWEAVGLPGWQLPAAGVESLLAASRFLLAWLAPWDPGWLLGPLPVILAVGLGVASWQGTRRMHDTPRRMAWTGVALLVALLWAPVAQEAARGDGLTVVVLDVGQGDATLLGTPGGRWILVDTGAGSGEWLARRLVRRGISRLELLVLTHPDLDHMGAAAGLLAHLPVGAVADGGAIRGTQAFREAVATADREDVPWYVWRAGDSWTLDGVEIQVLHPGPGGLAPGTAPNDASVVLHVRYGDFDLLLTGDISREVEARIQDRLGPVEVLKVAHHGSRTSTGPGFLQAVRPELATISAGRDNRFGHPHASVLLRLREGGIPVVRTDRHGTVTLRADHQGQYAVTTERGEVIDPP